MRSALILGFSVLVEERTLPAQEPPPRNLLVNGGFERPVFAPGTFTLAA